MRDDRRARLPQLEVSRRDLVALARHPNETDETTPHDARNSRLSADVRYRVKQYNSALPDAKGVIELRGAWRLVGRGGAGRRLAGREQ